MHGLSAGGWDCGSVGNVWFRRVKRKAFKAKMIHVRGFCDLNVCSNGETKTSLKNTCQALLDCK